jgi:hypothetical protein
MMPPRRTKEWSATLISEMKVGSVFSAMTKCPMLY